MNELRYLVEGVYDAISDATDFVTENEAQFVVDDEQDISFIFENEEVVFNAVTTLTASTRKLFLLQQHSERKAHENQARGS